jgi:RNA polymerase sigma-70 factor (ECF subfamily)
VQVQAPIDSSSGSSSSGNGSMKITRDEFVRLAMEQLDAVDRVARSLARDSAAADDLIQETYLRAVRAQDRFDLHTFGIRPWLLRILHNTHINREKRERRQPRAMGSDALEASAQPVDLTPLTPPPALERGSFDDEELNAALDKLPADLRTILILWAVDELSYKEMAHVLEIPIGTVMSRVYRARQKLHELLPQRVRGKGDGRSEARE